MKRKLAAGFLAAFTAATLMLGGCGKSEDEASDQAKATSEAGSGEQTASAEDEAGGAATGDEQEQVTIKFTYWGSGDEKKAIEEAVEKFMETYPNITVDLMHIPNEDFLTKLNAMIAAGEAPDVSYSASWKCQMGEDGLIYNFFDLLDDMGLEKDDYVSTCWWNWSPDESAGPVQANVTTNLMYNVDCFADAGLALPPTKVEEAW